MELFLHCIFFHKILECVVGTFLGSLWAGQNLSNHFLWTLLCELEHIHAGTEKGFPKNCYGKVGSIELSKMSWEADT